MMPTGEQLTHLTKVEWPHQPPNQPARNQDSALTANPFCVTMSVVAPSSSFVGASYPAEITWNPVLSAAESDDPAALVSYRILPLSVGVKRLPRSVTTHQEALMIELKYRHGTLKRQLLLKHRFRGAASLEKKGRNEVAINYLASDDPTQRELTEHIYFETPLDALDFQMRLTEYL